MKNLKKVVALSLAAVMMFGMMVVGAGAASYKDVEDSDFGTAIDVMSSIEIIKGNEGNFNPDGNLCRADALLLVGKIMLGEEGLKALSAATATKYSDVPADAYYAGAVAWATKEGIVAGNGAGKFNPWDNMSGIGFAKLLLNALGYNSAVEGYVDVAWSEQIININYDAALAGLLKGLDGVDLNKALTREQAAQMAFNAVTSDHRVAYADELGVVNGELTTVYKRYEYTTGTLTDKFALSYMDPVYGKDNVVGGYWYFVKDALNEKGEIVKVPVTDANGIVKASTPTTPDADIVIEGYISYNDLAYGILVNPVTEEYYKYNTTKVTKVGQLYGLTGTGVNVYAWSNFDPATKLNTIHKVDYSYEVLAKVTYIYDEVTELYTFTVAEEDNTYTVKYSDKANADNSMYDNLVALNIADGEMGAYVTVGYYATYSAKDEDYVDAWTGYALAEKVTGVAETIGKDGASIKLDGEVIYVAKNAFADTAKDLNDADMADVRDYWLDSAGNILRTEIAKDATPDALYLYITSVDSVAGKWDEDTNKYLPAYSVTGFDLTGAKHTFNIGDKKTVANSKNTGAGDTTNVTELAAKQFITYKLNKDGNLVVADVVVAVKDEIATGKTEALKATDVQFNGKYITADTKFVYIYEADKVPAIPGNEFYCDIVTGAHEIDANSNFYQFLVKDSNDVELVVIMSAPKVVVTPAEDLIYIGSWNSNFKYYTLAADGETKLCNYYATINGENVTITVDSKGAQYSGWYSFVEKDGVYTLSKTTTGYTCVDVVDVKGGIVVGNGRYYTTLTVEGKDYLVDLTDADVYNLSYDESATSVARLYTLSGSKAIKNVEIGVQFAEDPVTHLFHAVAIYVTNVKD